MFRDEADMLQCRLEAMQGYPVQHVIVESPVTHRGVLKPLHYHENAGRFRPWHDRIAHVVTELPEAPPWDREHAQRNAAWPVIDAQAADDDIVIIGDCDEIPSGALMTWKGPGPVASARMRTCLFAVDWEVPQSILPPPIVVAKVKWLRARKAEGMGLAQVRDARDRWPVLDDGGWHLSWIGGPERQREKLETATCHTELLGAPEGEMIRDGTRYRSDSNGGGLPVVPVDVDETWPRFIWEKRCPAEWFRPR
jgi:beta-1,4-mannosyl-glycoprotein beta-1,4-N-acetylglucosaminyltransferase